MTKYIRNENGGIHSIDDETLGDADGLTPFQRLQVESNGRRYLPFGWSEVDEKTARKEHPQLFGAPDPNMRMTAAEMQDARERMKWEAEFGAPTDEGK